MNAYELEQDAFDSACEFQEEKMEYIQRYADGAFELNVNDDVAQRILDCRKAFKNSQMGLNNHYHLVQIPLEEIEI